MVYFPWTYEPPWCWLVLICQNMSSDYIIYVHIPHSRIWISLHLPSQQIKNQRNSAGGHWWKYWTYNKGRIDHDKVYFLLRWDPPSLLLCQGFGPCIPKLVMFTVIRIAPAGFVQRRISFLPVVIISNRGARRCDDNSFYGWWFAARVEYVGCSL